MITQQFFAQYNVSSFMPLKLWLKNKMILLFYYCLDLNLVLYFMSHKLLFLFCFTFLRLWMPKALNHWLYFQSNFRGAFGLKKVILEYSDFLKKKMNYVIFFLTSSFSSYLSILTIISWLSFSKHLVMPL